MRRLSTGMLVRIAVIVNVLGMLLLIPILVGVSALAVGLFMLAGLLISVAIGLYLAAVIRDLRRREAV